MSENELHKKRGRPATGTDPLVTARLPQQMIEALEGCAKADETSRSEIVRVAVAKHLKAKGYLPK